MAPAVTLAMPETGICHGHNAEQESRPIGEDDNELQREKALMTSTTLGTAVQALNGLF